MAEGSSNRWPILDLRQTERGIRLIKEAFQTALAAELNLLRVSAPLFVLSGTGVNDNLNGIEQPAAFAIKGMNGARAEMVQSLAKWKRMALADYGFQPGEGIYTDMNAIRPDELLDETHSIYVDQWDWERVMGDGDADQGLLAATQGRQDAGQYAVLRDPAGDQHEG